MTDTSSVVDATTEDALGTVDALSTCITVTGSEAGSAPAMAIPPTTAAVPTAKPNAASALRGTRFHTLTQSPIRRRADLAPHDGICRTALSRYTNPSPGTQH